MIYFATILFIIIYALLLFFWEKEISWRLNPRIATYARRLHYLGMIICVAVAVSYSNFDVGLRGLWTTRIIIIFTLLTGVFMIFLTDKTSLKRPERWYFRIFSFLPILIAGALLIPFLGVVVVFSLYGQLKDPATKNYYQDDQIRVQSTFVGILGKPKTDIFEKIFIFEKQLKRVDFWTDDIDSIHVSYDQDSTRIIVYGLYDFDQERKGETETICLKPMK